ncbi:hypothetical protein ON010_g214 [Phytophthora cinnamomi]|nr:hypothetical protein ON010_g214 [Phytophthora cinnamomi]
MEASVSPTEVHRPLAKKVSLSSLGNHQKGPHLQYFLVARTQVEWAFAARKLPAVVGAKEVERRMARSGTTTVEMARRRVARTGTTMATTGGTQSETTLFLYDSQRASARSLNKVFEVTDSVEVIRRLHENESISSDSIVSAFNRAAGCGKKVHSYGPDQPKIVMALCDDAIIPSETINEAFVIAAQNGRQDVVECMRDDSRISLMGEAFAAAAGSGNKDLMESLYDVERVSPDAILKAFENAPIHGNLSIIAYLVKLLSEERVPRVIKYKAFVSAAKRSKYTYMLEVLSSKIGEWPLNVLKEAHDAALYCAPRNYISKLTCDQLFNSKKEDRLKAIVKLMENWPQGATKK